MSVLLVPLLGYIMFRNRPRPRTLAGIVLATVGLSFLTLTNFQLKISWGDGLTIICASLFALQTIFLGRYLSTSDFRQIAIVQLAGCAVLSTLVLPMLETPFLVWDITFAVYLFVTGVLATGFCFYCQSRAQQYTSANRAALIFSLEPFFAALFSYLLAGQILTEKEWLGGILVVVGIIVSEFELTSNQEPVGSSNGSSAG
jgi:drug/metabolite transporter (DMT)-like permease